MKVQATSTVGLDIGSDQVRMVVVSHRKGQPTVTGVAAEALGPEVLQDGRLQDPEGLVQVLLRLKARCRVHRLMPVGLSVAHAAGVMQIVKLPKQVPGNLAQFVAGELKQCVTLAGREIVTDYCHPGGGQQVQSHLVAAGCDLQELQPFVEAVEQAGLNLGWIEPPQLAYVRAFYHRQVLPHLDHNVLLLTLRDGWVHLAVFRSGALDFVRSRRLEPSGTKRELARTLAEDVKALVQYYQVEVSPEGCQWQVLLFSEPKDALPRSLSAALKRVLASVTPLWLDPAEGIEVSSGTAPDENPAADLSALALGVALWRAGEPLTVNLLPEEVRQVRQIKRQGLFTLAAAAVVFLVMGLVTVGLSVRTDRMRAALQEATAADDHDTTIKMVEQRSRLEAAIGQLKAVQQELQQIRTRRQEIPWAAVLQELRAAMPDHLWLGRLDTPREGRTLTLHGLSRTWGAIGAFANALNRCDHIEQAEVVDKGQVLQDGDEFIRYQIRCRLKAETESSS